MKYVFLIFLLSLNSCYVYKAYEPANEEDFKTFKEQIETQKKYKISTEDKTFKITAEKWEGDSLIAFKNGNQNDTIILAENQITDVKHEMFSKSRSNLLTFGSYGIIGVILYILLK